MIGNISIIGFIVAVTVSVGCMITGLWMLFSHDIYFSFIFGEEIFKFCRNSINAHTVWKCNDSYEKVEEIGLSDYCKWLDSKYAISLPELSFRDAVGRYIRVYGKNNCDERHL